MRERQSHLQTHFKLLILINNIACWGKTPRGMSPLGLLPRHKGGVLPHLEEFNKHAALRHNPYLGKTVTTHNGSEHFILPAL